MTELSIRGIVRRAFWAGLVAGLFLAASQTLLAAWVGFRPGIPWNLFASVGVGPGAMERGYGPVVFVVGVLLHFGLSGLFGTIFGLAVARMPARIRDSYLAQGAIGSLYGLALYLLNIELIARAFYPWFHDARFSGAPQLLAHVFAFGLPLGWYLCLKLRDIEVPGVHKLRHRWQVAGGEEETARFRDDLRAGHKDRRA